MLAAKTDDPSCGLVRVLEPGETLTQRDRPHRGPPAMRPRKDASPPRKPPPDDLPADEAGEEVIIPSGSHPFLAQRGLAGCLCSKVQKLAGA